MRCARSFAPVTMRSRTGAAARRDAVRATVRKMSNQEADDVAAACAVVCRLAREETALAMPECWTARSQMAPPALGSSCARVCHR